MMRHPFLKLVSQDPTLLTSLVGAIGSSTTHFDTVARHRDELLISLGSNFNNLSSGERLQSSLREPCLDFIGLY